MTRIGKNFIGDVQNNVSRLLQLPTRLSVGKSRASAGMVSLPLTQAPRGPSRDPLACQWMGRLPCIVLASGGQGLEAMYAVLD